MDALPYVDDLVKEYLLFRGFTGALAALEAELASDKAGVFEVDRVVALVLGPGGLVRGLECRRLLAFWRFLSERVFSVVGSELQERAREMERAVKRRYLVHAAGEGRRDKVAEFFEREGPGLRQAGDDWHVWFGLQYAEDPASHPAFRAFFAAAWSSALLVNFRNFLSAVFAQLPLPAILKFNAERLRREELELDIETLRAEKMYLEAALEEQRARRRAEAAGGGGPGGGPEERAASSRREANGRPATPEAPEAPEPPPEPLKFSEEVVPDHDVNKVKGRSREGIADATAGGLAGDFRTETIDVFPGHRNTGTGVTCCTFSPDGMNAASASSDGMVAVWTPPHSQHTHRNATLQHTRSAHTSYATCIEWGKVLAYGTQDGRVKGWNADYKAYAFDIAAGGGGSRAILDIACSPTSELLAVGAQQSALPDEAQDALTLWDLTTLQKTLDLPTGINAKGNGTESTTSIMFNHNGRMLLMGGSQGTIKLFDMSSHGVEIMAWKAGEGISAACFSPNRRSIWTLTTEGCLDCWSLEKPGEFVETIDLMDDVIGSYSNGDPHRIAIDPASEYIVASSSLPAAPLVRFGQRGQESAVCGKLEASGGAVRAVAWHPTQKWALLGTSEGAVETFAVSR